MKKLSFFFIFAAAVMAFAQQPAPQAIPAPQALPPPLDAWNLRAGINFSSISNSDYDSDYGSIFGFQIGLAADFGIAALPFGGFYFQPGLMFISKGNSYSYSDKNLSEEATWKLYYLELPLMALLKYPVNETFTIIANAGPYLAFGLSGAKSYEWDGFGAKDKGEIDLFKSNTQRERLGRLDAGLGLGAGVEYGRFYLGLSYDLGIKELGYDKTQIGGSNSTFSINVGYRFWQQQPPVPPVQPEPQPVAQPPPPQPAAQPEPEPEPVAPPPMVLDTVPQPVAIDTVPQPVVLDTVPQPVVLDTVPQPVVLDTVPKPVVLDTVPQPVVLDTVPKPVAIDTVPKPVAIDTVPKPVAIDTMPPPPAPVVQPQPEQPSFARHTITIDVVPTAIGYAIGSVGKKYFSSKLEDVMDQKGVDVEVNTDVGSLGFAAQYEYQPFERMSLAARFAYLGLDVDVNFKKDSSLSVSGINANASLKAKLEGDLSLMSVEGHLRTYPFAGTFFLDAVLGYVNLALSFDGETIASVTEPISGLKIDTTKATTFKASQSFFKPGLKLGWRISFGKNGGFTFEPAFNFCYGMRLGGKSIVKQIMDKTGTKYDKDTDDTVKLIESIGFIGGPGMSLSFGYRF